MLYLTILIADYACDLSSDSLSGVSTKDKLGWLYPKNSILKRIVDRITLEMAQAGIDKKIFDKYFDNLSNMDCESETFVEIGFDISQIIFFLLIKGIVLALAINFIEVIVNFLKRSKWSFRKEQNRSPQMYPDQRIKGYDSPCAARRSREDRKKSIGLRRRSTLGEVKIPENIQSS